MSPLDETDSEMHFPFLHDVKHSSRSSIAAARGSHERDLRCQVPSCGHTFTPFPASVLNEIGSACRSKRGCGRLLRSATSICFYQVSCTHASQIELRPLSRVSAITEETSASGPGQTLKSCQSRVNSVVRHASTDSERKMAPIGRIAKVHEYHERLPDRLLSIATVALSPVPAIHSIHPTSLNRKDSINPIIFSEPAYACGSTIDTDERQIHQVECSLGAGVDLAISTRTCWLVQVETSSDGQQ